MPHQELQHKPLLSCSCILKFNVLTKSSQGRMIALNTPVVWTCMLWPCSIRKAAWQLSKQLLICMERRAGQKFELCTNYPLALAGLSYRSDSGYCEKRDIHLLQACDGSPCVCHCMQVTPTSQCSP